MYNRTRVGDIHTIFQYFVVVGAFVYGLILSYTAKEQFWRNCGSVALAASAALSIPVSEYSKTWFTKNRDEAKKADDTNKAKRENIEQAIRREGDQ